MKNLLIILSLISACFADEQKNAAINGDLVFNVNQDRFHEPVYPKGTNIALLQKLVSFFDERIQPQPKEDWERLKLSMEQANLPRLATLQDIKTTEEKINNLSNDPVLVVLRHLDPMIAHKAMNIKGLEYRVYWIDAKGSLDKGSIGYGLGGTPLSLRLQKDNKSR